MSHINSEEGAIHQLDSSQNYHDEDDLITFQFESNQIEFYFSHLSRYSKFIRDRYLPLDVKNRFPQDLIHFKEQQNVNTENIIFFFKLLKNDFNINQDLTYNEYKDLIKLTEFLEIKKFLINLNQYFENQKNITDFQIQIILQEIENNNNIENSQLQLNVLIEELLSKKIDECLQKENFTKIPIPIVYRIFEKSDKKQISSDLLYDFIKKNEKSNFVLYYFLDIECLSDDRFNELFKSLTNLDESCKHYINYLPYSLTYIMKLKNDKEKNQKQIDDLILEKNQLKEKLDQMTKSFNDSENDKNQLKQENDLLKEKLNETEKEKSEVEQENKKLIDVISQQKDEIERLEFENEEKERKIDEIERIQIEKDEEHEKYIKNESFPLYNKGDYNKVDIFENEMNNNQKEYAIEITKKSLQMYEDHYECAKCISNQFKSKYGGEWCVTLHPQGYGGMTSFYYDDGYISFSMGEFYVVIFKSSVGDESIRLTNKGDYNKVDIFKNEMNNDQKEYAIETTKKSLKMYENHYECAKYISEQFKNKYGGVYCVFIHPENYGGSSFLFYEKCYIDFTIGEFCVQIFKPGIGDESIRLVNKGDYNKVDILENKMNNNQKEYAIDITKKSLHMHSDHYECAKYISDQFKSKYGGVWCVNLHIQDFGNSDFIYYDNCFINFTIGEFYVQIFKSSVADESIRLVNKGDYDKVDILENKMNNNQKEYAIEITKKSLQMHSDHFECGEYVRKQFKSKYGGEWCVNLHMQGYGSSNFIYYDNCYINFAMGEFCVQIFKPGIADDLILLNNKGDYNKVDILENKMNNYQKEYAIEITKKSLQMHSGHYECTKYISDQFKSKYGGEWCAILHPENYGGSCFAYYGNCYIAFIIGEFYAVIFKESI